MAQPADLEARIRVLEDIEAIKKLKSKYWRCIDKRLLDELSECFSEDAVADFEHDGQYDGRKAIMDFFRERSCGIQRSGVRVHQGHNPEIDITSGTTAKGTWQLYFYRIPPQANKRRRSAGFYYDEYIKERGKWRIKSTSVTYVFREELKSDNMS